MKALNVMLKGLCGFIKQTIWEQSVSASGELFFRYCPIFHSAQSFAFDRMNKEGKKQTDRHNEPYLPDTVSILSTGWEPVGVIATKSQLFSFTPFLQRQAVHENNMWCCSSRGGGAPGCRMNAWLVSDRKKKAHYPFPLCLSQKNMKLKLVMPGSENDCQLCCTRNRSKWGVERLWYLWFNSFSLELLQCIQGCFMR